MTEPTQADREAAAAYLKMAGKITSRSIDDMHAGKWDDTEYVLAFTKHREDTEKRIVEWLRAYPLIDYKSEVAWDDLADAIEAGDHHITNGQLPGISG